MIQTLTSPNVRRLYIIAWMILITVTLLQSSRSPLVGPPAPPGPPSYERELFLTSGHVVAFSVMLVLLWWALHPAPRALLVALAVCWTYGGATELLQMLVPDRGASWGDFAVDCLVSGLAALIIYGCSSWATHRERPSLLR